MDERRRIRGARIPGRRASHYLPLHSDAYAAGRLTYLDQRDLDLPPAFTFNE